MNWTIDPAHTTLEFAVKHMGLSTVKGRFRALDGTVVTDERGALQGLEVTVDVNSLDTAEQNRDGHLRSPDFFDVASYPTATFKSTRVEAKGGQEYRVTGDLVIRGVSREVTLDVETTPAVKDPWGNQRAAAEAKGKINRKEFGLTWNQVLEFGALLVSEDVRLTIDVQAVQSANAAD
ncbi:YceI family protein [Deinococcus yavapaiensis]|uniref:Polyisoprenoid-binding protein YceI n=1 Tax=Deinococcus yavapaiensis KR-236 TaxID=694435 RepID=A0A318S6V1_9DEIO|nr:YceI family protein [Deinococcus yavapaiensis]PYE53485.1 polyisoprenoid-binding protein YceI [Deinococcus yavapaiensis KR-236]